MLKKKTWTIDHRKGVYACCWLNNKLSKEAIIKYSPFSSHKEVTSECSHNKFSPLPGCESFWGPSHITHGANTNTLLSGEKRWCDSPSSDFREKTDAKGELLWLRSDGVALRQHLIPRQLMYASLSTDEQLLWCIIDHPPLLYTEKSCRSSRNVSVSSLWAAEVLRHYSCSVCMRVGRSARSIENRSLQMGLSDRHALAVPWGLSVD